MVSDQKPPPPKHRPIRRLAMVGGETDDSLQKFNSYKCLVCDLNNTYARADNTSPL
jgi:hypothetical protein